MISATILNILNDGPEVSIEYVLLDDEDPIYNLSGTLPVPIGSTPSDIQAKLAPIVDAANYAHSLRPLINSTMDSSNPAPLPVVPVIRQPSVKENSNERK